VDWRGSKRPENATAWPLTRCSAASLGLAAPEDQVDVDRLGPVVARSLATETVATLSPLRVLRISTSRRLEGEHLR
jgi:hypothetical protein